MADHKQIAPIPPSHRVTPKTVEMAKIVARDVVYFALDKQLSHVNHLELGENLEQNVDSEMLKTVRYQVTNILTHNQEFFSNLSTCIDSRLGTIEHDFVLIADDMFSDGRVNWGRIVTILAFGAILAQFAVENRLDAHNDQQNVINFIAQFIGKYVADKLGSWIDSNGGWEALKVHFPTPESVNRRNKNTILGSFLAGVGLAALVLVATR